MATFEPLKLGAPDLFGVRLTGAVGRAEKGRLKELADRCLASGRLRIVFDLADLDAIGGGGAAVLADFQRRLLAAGGKAVFAGANDLVLKFLRLQFGELPLFLHPDAAAAANALAAEPAPAAGGAAGEGAPQDDEYLELDSDAGDVPADGLTDGALDDLLGSFAAGSPPPAPEPAAPPRSRGGPAAASRAQSTRPEAGAAAAQPQPQPRPQPQPGAVRSGGGPPLLPLDQVLAALRGMDDPAALETALRDLLHEHDLADEAAVLVRRGDRLAAVDGREVAAAGVLASALLAAGRPLTLLDFSEGELPEDESRLLAELRPDLIVPILLRGVLQVVAVLRRGAGREYGVGETFALALLARALDAPAPQGEPAAAGDRDLPGQLRRKVRQMQALFSISEDLARLREEQRLLDLLAVTITSQLGIRRLVFLGAEQETLAPALVKGAEHKEVAALPPLGAEARAYFAELPLPVPVGELPTPLLRLREAFAAAGMALVAPLRTRGRLLGLLLLGAPGDGERNDLDLDFLSTLLNQAAIALDGARMLQHTQDQSLGMVRVLVSLLERRHQGSGGMTDRISQLVGEVAREMAFPPERLRDLTLGTVLRDVGMIPISDLVLRSPRKLTESEWRQIKAHPEVGVQLLAPLQLAPTVHEVVLHHHERFNGEGYPRGLQGRAIPAAARIVAVVESYVAMTAELPYRAALAPAEAISILSENWGMRYDPEVVEAFLRVLAREVGGGGELETAAAGATNPGRSP